MHITIIYNTTTYLCREQALSQQGQDRVTMQLDEGGEEVLGQDHQDIGQVAAWTA